MTVAPVVVARRYRLSEQLGVGGMGRVWLARDEVLERDVAIKEIVLPAEMIAAERDAVQRRTLREARAAARVSHPNAAQVYDVCEADGRTWIVMEYVRSRSLQEVLQADGPLPPRRVAEIGLALLAALDAAHRAGVRHRDVKPANVLLGDDGRVVLTDFGIATVEGDGIITSSELVLGSPQYMSPERVRDGTTLPASDLWSLGATLYTAVEGHSPYERASAVETLTAVAADEPDPARRAGVLAPVLAGLLRKDPESRIGVAETRRLLQKAATDERAPRRNWPWHTRRAGEPVVPRQRTPEKSPEPGSRTRRSALIAAVAAAVLAGTAATWLALRPEPAPSAQGGPTATPTTVRPPVPGQPEPGASRTPTTAPGTGKAGTAQPRPALPAGWRDYRDPTGFRVYVPDGWKRSREGSIVYFRASGRVLGVDQTNDPQWNPVADWRGKASYRVGRGDFPGYDQIRIAAVPYWLKAADWEFTFDGQTRQHVDNRGFVVSKHQAYGIYWQCSDARWDSLRPDLQLVFDSFRPAPT